MPEPSQDQLAEFNPFDPTTGELKPIEERLAAAGQAIMDAKAAEREELLVAIGQMIDERIDARLAEIEEKGVKAFADRIAQVLIERGVYSPPAKS